MKPKEFEITLRLRVEADNLTVAECLATAIVNDLKKVGEEYVDRPINSVRWQRISPVFPDQIGAPAPGLSLVPKAQTVAVASASAGAVANSEADVEPDGGGI
jgi:hypothetical protein